MALSLFNDKKPTQDPEKILEHAQAKAEKIVERAMNHSEQILKAMEKTSHEMKKEMETFFKQSSADYLVTITEASKEFVKSYGDLVPQIKEKYLQGVIQATDSFKQEALKNIPSVKDAMTDDLKIISSEYKQKLDSEWQAVQTELQAYKKQKIEQIDKEMNTAVKELLKQTVGDLLTPAQQQQLVISALEKAKKEGIFNNG